MSQWFHLPRKLRGVACVLALSLVFGALIPSLSWAKLNPPAPDVVGDADEYYLNSREGHAVSTVNSAPHGQSAVEQTVSGSCENNDLGQEEVLVSFLLRLKMLLDRLNQSWHINLGSH
jgi:hypothetical protein